MQISVVIPLYNKQREIERTLASVKAQTRPPAEVLVIDDGSTDGGAAAVRDFALEGLRLIQQENAGECTARNRGIQEAPGDLIAFLDADDEWEPEFLSAIAALHDMHPHCGLYATAYQIVDRQGRRKVPAFRRVPPPGEGGVLQSYFQAALNGGCLNASSAAAPKSALERIGGFPAGVQRGGDRVTWLRLAADNDVSEQVSTISPV